VHRGSGAPYSRIVSVELDCLRCGACCRTGTDGRILIPAEDLARWRRMGRSDIAEAVQPGHFGMVGFATRADGSCVHLGTPSNRNACSIYEIRGTSCRDFERGSAQCLEFRRDAASERSRCQPSGESSKTGS
jgi:Fe-S-cluster containining protein